MGYDMRAVQSTVEQRAAHEAKFKEGMALYGQRNGLPEDYQAKHVVGDSFSWDPNTGTPEWWDLHRRAEAAVKESESAQGYFRLNIWGMGVCRDVMEVAGMLDVSDRPRSAWPKPQDFGANPDMDEEDAIPGSPESAWFAAMREVRVQGVESGLIPVRKLCSNDGWIVTPDEIRNSLAALECHGTVADSPWWWDDWIAYLRKMIDRGGFEVH